ncbi:DUF488 domain-containing protein [Muricauda sp. NFXS6]|uniref:DUF488 domain-containing protein n=1 Tax=Allomuricauda sp. NFXS6 TaxID=2819094 RepID=UPI0032DFE208
MKFYTLGVYNSTEAEFFEKLVAYGIDLFCDIRMRRGVRGATYSFVNSNRLQEKLKSLDIAYEHLESLAPSAEIRQLQLDHDKAHGVKQRERSTLCEPYVRAYTQEVLEGFDMDSVLGRWSGAGHQKVAFFCVEDAPHACHRSLVLNAFREAGHPCEHL